jgi:hypothetical protein
MSNWVTKAGLRHTDLTRYCKVVLGYCSKAGVKQEAVVCEALDRKGLHKPIGAGNRWWIGQNGPHIANIARSTAGKESVKPVYTKSDDSFLQTFEWRRVRMVALKKYGARCQCCGASPSTGAVMNVDHIKPRKLFPELALDVSNLQILCGECNHGKGNWDMTDWRTTESV